LSFLRNIWIVSMGRTDKIILTGLLFDTTYTASLALQEAIHSLSVCWTSVSVDNLIKGAKCFKSNTPTFSLYNTSMHFRVTGAFTFVFMFLSILSIASPLSPRTNITVNGLDVRQKLDIAGSKQSSSIHHSHHRCANVIPQSSSR